HHRCLHPFPHDALPICVPQCWIPELRAARAVTEDAGTVVDVQNRGLVKEIGNDKIESAVAVDVACGESHASLGEALAADRNSPRSEEHTSELQSLAYLV